MNIGNTNKPIEDAIGQWINVGDVITHANRAGSSCWLDVGVVTKVHKDGGSLIWRRVEGIRWNWRGDVPKWASRETVIHRTDLCTKITGMTRARLVAKFGLGDDAQVTEDIANQPSLTFHRPLPEEEFEPNHEVTLYQPEGD